MESNIHVIGGKSVPQDRGSDRTLVIDDPAVLQAVAGAAKWMRICQRTNTAIRDRLRKECRALWPRRKQHPTLKSFRHQLGSNLKASSESDKTIAYMTGHQSIESISVYGNRRSGLVTNCISDLHRTLTCQKFVNPSSLLFLVENAWWAVSRCHSAWQTDEQLHNLSQMNVSGRASSQAPAICLIVNALRPTTVNPVDSGIDCSKTRPVCSKRR